MSYPQNNASTAPYIGLQSPREKVFQKHGLDKDEDFCSWVKNVRRGNIQFNYFDVEHSKRYLQMLFDIGQEAILAEKPLSNWSTLTLDFCVLDVECLHLFAKLQGAELWIGLYITATCKLATSEDAETELVSCLSSLQLTSVERREFIDHDDNGRMLVTQSFYLRFVDGAALLAKMPIIKTASITTPVAIVQNKGFQIACSESLLLSAALQVPTLKRMNIESFCYESPFYVQGIFSALSKRPDNCEPLLLEGLPFLDVSTLKLLPILNEKRITNLPIVVQPDNPTTEKMLEHALKVIEESLFIRSIRYFVLYDDAIDHTLFFLRELRNILPRLRLPLVLTMDPVRMRKSKDEVKNAKKKQSEIHRLAREITQIEALMNLKDLQNLALLLYPKVIYKFRSPLQLLSVDIIRKLREFIV